MNTSSLILDSLCISIICREFRDSARPASMYPLSYPYNFGKIIVLSLIFWVRKEYFYIISEVFSMRKKINNPLVHILVYIFVHRHWFMYNMFLYKRVSLFSFQKMKSRQQYNSKPHFFPLHLDCHVAFWNMFCLNIYFRWDT